MATATKTQNTKAFDKVYCTQLLLKYWPHLKKHCENLKTSYFEVEKVEMQILIDNMFTDPDVFVQGLVRGKERTQIILSHISETLRLWEGSCGATFGGRIRRRIIRGLYLDKPHKTMAQLALEEKKPVGIIGKYRDSAIRELSGLLFGVSGLFKTKEAMYIHTFEVKPQCLSSLVTAPAEDMQ